MEGPIALEKEVCEYIWFRWAKSRVKLRRLIGAMAISESCDLLFVRCGTSPIAPPISLPIAREPEYVVAANYGATPDNLIRAYRDGGRRRIRD